MVMLLAMLPIMSRSHLLWILCLRLGLSNDNEALIFQLSDFFPSELSLFGLRIRTALSSLFGLRFSFSVFGLVLASFARLLIVSATVITSGSAVSSSSVVSVVSVSSSFPVSTAVVSAFIALSCSFFRLDFNFCLFNLFSRCRFCFNFNIGGSFNRSLRNFCNFLLSFNLTDSFNFRLDHSNRLRLSDRFGFYFSNSNFNLFLSG